MKAQVSVYSQIDPGLIRKANLKPITAMNTYLQSLRKKWGDVPVAVLPEGPLTIPYVA
jgi:hypothetical protein